MATAKTQAEGRSHRYAWLTVAFFLILFLGLVLMIALAPNFLAAGVFAGLTRGHVLVLVLHIGPVTAAWLYIYLAPDAEP